MRHTEQHFTARIGWLRAAVLGANDGIVSTASLVVGVAAADATHASILVAGVAGLVAGAMSMAAGEYVSVSSQADTEKADLERERSELARARQSELAELARIYVKRGLDKALARQVADALMAHDALGRACARRAGHFRNDDRAAGSGCAGVGSDVCGGRRDAARSGGGFPARFGCRGRFRHIFDFPGDLGRHFRSCWRRSVLRATARVTFWGALAMALTAGVGALFGVAA